HLAGPAQLSRAAAPVPADFGPTATILVTGLRLTFCARTFLTFRVLPLRSLRGTYAHLTILMPSRPSRMTFSLHGGTEELFLRTVLAGVRTTSSFGADSSRMILMTSPAGSSTAGFTRSWRPSSTPASASTSRTVVPVVIVSVFLPSTTRTTLCGAGVLGAGGSAAAAAPGAADPPPHAVASSDTASSAEAEAVEARRTGWQRRGLQSTGFQSTGGSSRGAGPGGPVQRPETRATRPASATSTPTCTTCRTPGTSASHGRPVTMDVAAERRNGGTDGTGGESKVHAVACFSPDPCR